MIGGKINLAKLKHVLMEKKGKGGNPVKGIFIPIKLNDLFEGKDGNVYLDIIAFEVKEKKEGFGTHIVKQSLPKEIREGMTEEQKNNEPIIGNLTVIEHKEIPNNLAEGVVNGDDDDLPF